MKTNKKKKKCRPLEYGQAEQLVRLIMQQTENSLHRGVVKQKRITVPSGAVMLF